MPASAAVALEGSVAFVVVEPATQQSRRCTGRRYGAEPLDHG